MKNFISLQPFLYLILVCCLIFGCQPEKSPRLANDMTSEKAIKAPSVEAQTDSQAIRRGLSYTYYQNWRNIARILYEDKDPASHALYRTMVDYLEQIKDNKLEITAEEMFVKLSNSFRDLQSPVARNRIDSLLVADGQPPFYNIQSNTP